MAEDERLREALLELQFLRDREARILEDTRTLLECLETYSLAQSPNAALTSLFHSLHNKIGSATSMVVAQAPDGTVEIAASDTAAQVGDVIAPPIDLFSRPRNVTDLSILGEWGGPLEFSAYAGLLIAPVQGGMALLSFRNRPETFGKDALNLALRLSGLAAQAVRNSLIESEKNLLSAAIAGSSSGFAISDATAEDRPLIYVNAAFESLSGYSAEDVLGQNCRFLTAEPASAPERVRLREAVETCSGGTFLLRNRRKSGELFWNELTLFPVRDARGRVQNLVATQSDVTERVEAAEERDRVRARMAQAMAATGDAFLVLEADRTVAFANGAVNDLFPSGDVGWRADTAFAANWAAYVADCEDLPGRLTTLLRNPDLDGLAEQPGGREIDLPDGHSVLLRAARLDDGGMVVSATDVTAMKSAQRLLAQRLAAIEATTDGIAVTDDVGRLIYLNSAAAGLLGYGMASAGLGKKWRRQYEGAAATSPQDAFETTLTRSAEGGDVTHEITGSPLENGGSVIVVRDITENLATEAREEELMRDLIRLQRQEAIAQLTAGIAHDFNNLLSAINGSATLIDMSPDLPEAVRPHVQRITAAGAQSAKMINRLLDIGAGTEAEGIFDSGSILRNLPGLVQPSLPERITFRVLADTAPMALRGNPGSLSQILINLALNARDAIGAAEGRIELRVSRGSGAAAASVAVGELDENATYACLEMSDSGSGMDAETAAHIFQPYFTTKGRHGTGLGLATVAMQVQSVGGAIGLISAPGVGTTISLYWPLAPLLAEGDGPVVDGSHDLTGMTVIVVDDDPRVGEVISTYLEANGAEVATCEDARDAAIAISEDPAAWSALITDYDMPVMNGGELAATVREMAPDLPIFVVTALARRLTDPRLVNGQVSGILSKPVDLEQLCGALAEAEAKRKRAEHATTPGR